MFSDVLFKLRILMAVAYSDQKWSWPGLFKWWLEEIWPQDVDARACCNGRECCCGGATLRQNWAKSLKVRKP